MDKDKIIVGGIYAVHVDMNPPGKEYEHNVFTQATVKDIDGDLYLRALFNGDHGNTSHWLNANQLGDQIGYNATYSQEYKDAQAELERWRQLQGDWEEIISTTSLLVFIEDYAVTNVRQELIRQVDRCLIDLNRIKATSWTVKP